MKESTVFTSKTISYEKNTNNIIRYFLQSAVQELRAQEGMRVFANAKIQVTGSMAVWGNVTNSASQLEGGQLKINDGASIEMRGNRWENSETATDVEGGSQHTGNLRFKVSSDSVTAQYLNGGKASFPSIIIASIKAVELKGNVVVRKHLLFESDGGYLIIRQYNLIMGENAAFSGFSAKRYVITNGSGLVKKDGLRTKTTFFFPVGRSAGDYTPATIEPLNGTASYSVAVQDFDASNIDLNVLRKGANIGRTWMVASSQSGAMAKLALVHYEKLAANGYDGLKSAIATYSGNGNWSTAGLQAETNIAGLPTNFWQQANSTAIGTSGSNGVYFTKVSGGSKSLGEATRLQATVVANPFINLLQVKYEGDDQVSITVTSTEGKLVYASGKIAKGVTRINATGWTSGIYQMTLKSETGKSTSFKVMKM